MGEQNPRWLVGAAAAADECSRTTAAHSGDTAQRYVLVSSSSDGSPLWIPGHGRNQEASWRGGPLMSTSWNPLEEVVTF
jgi:hypothetical protein